MTAPPALTLVRWSSARTTGGAEQIKVIALFRRDTIADAEMEILEALVGPDAAGVHYYFGRANGEQGRAPKAPGHFHGALRR